MLKNWYSWKFVILYKDKNYISQPVFSLPHSPLSHRSPSSITTTATSLPPPMSFVTSTTYTWSLLENCLVFTSRTTFVELVLLLTLSTMMLYGIFGSIVTSWALKIEQVHHVSSKHPFKREREVEKCFFLIQNTDFYPWNKYQTFWLNWSNF